ncbi:hypothetical protein [Bradyrhizobium sp. 179]|nr:hypothetical protein [Bradyrhizobium sp. 179]
MTMVVLEEHAGSAKWRWTGDHDPARIRAGWAEKLQDYEFKGGGG